VLTETVGLTVVHSYEMKSIFITVWSKTDTHFVIDIHVFS